MINVHVDSEGLVHRDVDCPDAAPVTMYWHIVRTLAEIPADDLCRTCTNA